MNAFENAEIEITAQRAADLLADGATVIDVRETYERDAGYIENPSHRARATRVERRGDRPHATGVFFCRLGMRSAMAASAFRSAATTHTR